ncbi:MAG: hypothetical protein LIV24_01385 [Eubacterium sp.]|nr:hypothetical protein [Eubacterium sp.]
MRGAKNKITKILITVALTLSMLGCATSVFAAGRDLVGGGTTRIVVRQSSASASAGASASGTASSGNAGAASTADDSVSAGQNAASYVSEQTNVSAAQEETQSSAAPATTIAAGNANTGYIDMITPFLVLFVWTFLLFWALTITLIRRSRDRQNAKYHEENLEFYRAVHTDIDLNSILTI